MNHPQIQEHLLALIEKTSTNLPEDVEARLREIQQSEDVGSASRFAMDAILENIAMARKEKTPICQDTGTLIFEIYYPTGTSTLELQKQIEGAIVEATARSLLRPNTVDSVTGKNPGNNLGTGHPYLHFNEWKEDKIEVHLLLKGGGSENVGRQYSLPDDTWKAGRDLEGVRRVVIDAVFQAQGEGCGPGIIGVGIGGDRATGYLLAKKQLFRKLTDRNPNPLLQELEERLFRELNELGIGTMGLGGKNTILGVKIGDMHRLPASYFVSIAYLCWAARRGSLSIDAQGNVTIS